MGVDMVARELLNHSLRLVQTQKFGDTHADKGGQLVVLELRVDLGNGLAEATSSFWSHFGRALGAVGESAAWSSQDAVENGARTATRATVIPWRGPFSRTDGNWRKRRVWPVGAVSKMMVS